MELIGGRGGGSVAGGLGPAWRDAAIVLGKTLVAAAISTFFRFFATQISGGYGL
jgi:hypothetical protein